MCFFVYGPVSPNGGGGPRSVLVQTSPPDMPPPLPISFPYPKLGTPALWASEGA